MAEDLINFDISIERLSEGSYRLKVTDAPGGLAENSFVMPFSDLEFENFLLKVKNTRRISRRIDSQEMQAAKIFGGRLFQAAFAAEVQTSLQRSIEMANQKDAGLRIRLSLAGAPELLDLPWEFLYNPALNRFLALSARTPLVRYVNLPEPPKPMLVQLPLKILVMISSPTDYPPLDVEREWKNLQQALADLEQRGLARLIRLETANLAALQRVLRHEDIHIFHFIGHGGFDERSQDGVLLLEDDNGRGYAVSGQYLGALLHDETNLSLAVLNACEGARTSNSDPFAGTAQSLVQQGIPAVIGMQFEVSDEAAVTFAHEFYTSLADGYAVEAALAEARKAIFAAGNQLEWGTPVLYLRASSGQIFEINKTTASGVTLPGGPAARLLLRRGAQAGLVIPLGPGVLALGRSADVSLQDDLISRRHVQVRGISGQYVIEDLNSTNGTFLNGERLSGARSLKPGDRVLIGGLELEFQADVAAKQPEPDSEQPEPPEPPAKAEPAAPPAEAQTKTTMKPVIVVPVIPPSSTAAEPVSQPAQAPKKAPSQTLPPKTMPPIQAPAGGLPLGLSPALLAGLAGGGLLLLLVIVMVVMQALGVGRKQDELAATLMSTTSAQLQPTTLPVATATGLLLATQPPPTQPVEMATATVPVGVPAVTTSLTLWYGQGSHAFSVKVLQYLAEQAAIEFPGLELKLVPVADADMVKLYEAALRRGGAPDLLLVDQGFLLQLEAPERDLLALDNEVDAEWQQYIPAGLGAMSYNRKLYALPLTINTLVLYYRPSLAAPPSTTEDVLSLARSGFHLSAPYDSYHLYSLSAAFGNQIADESGACVALQSGWVDYLAFLKYLNSAGAKITQYNTAQQAFMDGVTAFYLGGSWDVYTLSAKFGDDLAVALPPSGPAGNSAPFVGSEGFFVNPNTLYRRQALELIAWLTGPGPSATFGRETYRIPANLAVEQINPFWDVFQKTALNGTSLQMNTLAYEQYWTFSQSLYTAVLEQGMTPAVAVRTACQNVK